MNNSSPTDASVPAAGRQAGAPGSDSESSGASWIAHLSLRAKGIISLIIVIIYAGIVVILVTGERDQLFRMVQDLERVHRHEEQLVHINIRLARAIGSANENYFAGDTAASTRQVAIEMVPIGTLLAGLASIYPGLQGSVSRLETITAELATGHASRGVLAELRSELHSLVLRIESISRELRLAKEGLLSDYRVTYDRVTLETLSLLFFGVVLMGATITIFFTRLTWDIRRVSARALSIVQGYRGSPLMVTRGDEMGGLMESVNRMQQELRRREQQLELGRQEQFHQEKMAAVGSLAAAVAHEINNPIMAISGLTEALIEDGKKQLADHDREMLTMILEQARRISAITRQIAEFSVPHSIDPQLVDLNAIVRGATNFVRFDKRLRRIGLNLNLDPQLPAVLAVSDHLTQIIINVLVNAADALEPVLDRAPTIETRTATRNGNVVLEIIDNGIGMDAETLAHACDEFYSTKPRGRGSGLGLFICSSLIRQNGGELLIESEPGRGTRVQITFREDCESSSSQH